jgi:hypothetical protein
VSKGARVLAGGDCGGRVAQHFLPAARGDALAVDDQVDEDGGEIGRVGQGCPGAAEQPGGAGVVGDRVDQGDLPVADPAVDDLQSRGDRVGGRKDVLDGDAGTAQGPCEAKQISGSTRGRQ